MKLSLWPHSSFKIRLDMPPTKPMSLNYSIEKQFVSGRKAQISCIHSEIVTENQELTLKNNVIFNTFGFQSYLKELSLTNHDNFTQLVYLDLANTMGTGLISYGPFELLPNCTLTYSPLTGFIILDENLNSNQPQIYPSVGIPISTGNGWGTSIIDNSTAWNTAFSWGNHASAGYLTSGSLAGYATQSWVNSQGFLTSQISHADVVVDGDFTSQGIMLRGATAGTYSILTDNSANWNTAFGWGNHASAGYALASSLGDYLPLAGGTMTGDALIAWNNGQSIGKGRVDTGLGGYGGVSLYCSLGYELNWQAGWLTKWDQAGTNVENILLGSNLQFDASGYLADKAGVPSLGADERFLYNENAVKMFNWGGTDYLTFYCETQSGAFRLSWADVTDGRLISLPDEDGTLITDTTLGIILGDYVPYLGATNNVDLGLNNLTAKRISALVEFGLFDVTLNGEASITNNNGIFSYQPASGLSLFEAGVNSICLTNAVGTKTILSFSGITAPTKTITVPNANGTMALTSDLSAYAGLATANAFTPPSLTGSQATSALSIVQTYNTTGSPAMLYLNALHTASGASTLLADFRYASVTQFSVSKAGAVAINGVLSTGNQISIATSSDLRWNNRSRIYSDASGTIRLMNSALTDFDRLQFAGATNLCPALKRVSATLETRLADDSGFAATQSLYQRFGSGSPEGVVTAPIGARYSRTDGGAGTSFYVKESGTGNTGWVAK